MTSMNAKMPLPPTITKMEYNRLKNVGIDAIMIQPDGAKTLQQTVPGESLPGDLDVGNLLYMEKLLAGEDQEELLRRHTETQHRIIAQQADTSEDKMKIAKIVREEREVQKLSAQSAAQALQEVVEKRKLAAQQKNAIERERVLATEVASIDKDGRRTVTLTHNTETNTFTRFTTIHPGDGVTFPNNNSTVKCHYTGTLPASKGTTFDCSRQKQKEFTATLGKQALIQGWEWALTKMSLGERIVLTIAPDFAYSTSGVKGHIPPNSTLEFDLQLLQIDAVRVTDEASIKMNVDLLLKLKEEDLSQWVDDMSMNNTSKNKKKSKGKSKGKGKKKKKKR